MHLQECVQLEWETERNSSSVRVKAAHRELVTQEPTLSRVPDPRYFPSNWNGTLSSLLLNLSASGSDLSRSVPDRPCHPGMLLTAHSLRRPRLASPLRIEPKPVLFPQASSRQVSRPLPRTLHLDSFHGPASWLHALATFPPPSPH